MIECLMVLFCDLSKCLAAAYHLGSGEHKTFPLPAAATPEDFVLFLTFTAVLLQTSRFEKA